MSKVLVTGGNGFLGQHVVRELDSQGYEIFIASSSQYDLRDRYSAGRLIWDAKPDYIIHLAAIVGGIGFNQANPSKCLADNLAINLNVLQQALAYSSLKKFVAIGSVCAYPSETPIPFKETSLWDGYPEPTNAPYGLAKRMLLVQCQAYRQEHKFPAIYLLPTNLYGPGDHCNLENSHVIPAIIRKCVEAKRNWQKTIEIWGTGTATRDFLYVADAARGIVAAMKDYDGADPVNLGTGVETSISELVARIMVATDYVGEVKFISDRPDGQSRRVLDTSRAKAFGWAATMGLSAGLNRTVKWYEKVSQTEIEYA